MTAREKDTVTKAENNEQNGNFQVLLISNILNVNRLNSPIKRHTETEGIFKPTKSNYMPYKKLILDVG